MAQTPNHVMPTLSPIDLPRAGSVPPAPPVSQDPETTRLPRPLTPLIGRGREVQTALELLRRPDVRIVTLTGPGGVGKTRLALRLADDLRSELVGGSWFVPLGPVADPDLVLPAIARTLGVREVGDRPLAEALAAALGSKALLLVLDNTEHVSDAAPLVADLLAACPGLKVLATSREPLRISGERDVRVPPLPLPDPARLPPLAELARCDAVQLFVERAQAAHAGFALTPENAPVVAAICARLDGLPLAIELAAARVALFPPRELLDRLERRLPLLTGGPRDAPARLRTMRDAIAWSHDALSPEERAIFRRLAVFAGGFTLCAAERVGGGGAEPSDDAASQADGHGSFAPPVLDVVAALVAKSLLHRVECADGNRPDGPRLAMLETIREFGLEQLVASGEEAAIRRAHVAHFLALAERADAELLGPCQAAWLATLEAEHDNLRAALAWADASHDDETLLRLAAALARFWRFHWHHSEGQRWLERALARSDGMPAPWRAKALLGMGVMANMRCDYAAAAAFHRDALALYRQLPDRWAIARGLFHLGEAVGGQGDHDQATALFAESLNLFRDLGERPLAALALKDLGELARRRGDHRREAALLGEALAFCTDAGFAWGRAEVLTRLAAVARDESAPARAAALLGEALGLYREQGDTVGVAGAAIGLALLAGERERPDAATRLYAAAAALHESLGLREPQDKHPEERARLAGFRARLGDDDFAAIWSAGRALPTEEVAAEAATVAATLATRVGEPSPTHAPRHYPAGLSEREVEVLRLVAAGLTNAQIAERLFISPRTVNAHLNRIYGKIDVPNRGAAVRFAADHDLI